MNNEEKILGLLLQMNDRFDRIDARLDKIDARLDGLESRMDRLESRMDRLEERMDTLEEGQEEIRCATNALIEWAEKASSVYQLPLPRLGA